jgi:hypothetical protein
MGSRESKNCISKSNNSKKVARHCFKKKHKSKKLELAKTLKLLKSFFKEVNEVCGASIG